MEALKIITLLIAGLTTVIMQQFVAIGGGGISLIFILTVPILIGLSIILAIVYYFIQKKDIRKEVKNAWYIWFVVLLILLAMMFYPYEGEHFIF